MNKLTQGMVALSIAATTALGCGDVESLEELQAAVVANPGMPWYEQNNQVVASDGSGSQAMLGCYPGFAIAGYQPVVMSTTTKYPTPLNRETIKCVPFTPDPARPGIFLNRHSQREIWQVPSPQSGGHTIMHTCELGQVMVGFHAYKNFLACMWAKPTNPLRYAEALDLDTPDSTMPPEGSFAVPPGKRMHACLSTRVMSGIHLGKNQWSCATDQFPW